MSSQTRSQPVLRLSPDDAYVLLASLEVASFHDECEATRDQYLSLTARLNLLLEEHGEQGDTLEELLS